MKGKAAVGAMVAGLLLAGLAFSQLRQQGLAGYHRNPFALNRSGFGTMLARLGQKNLDRAWHFGAVASELSQRGEQDEHAGHDHGEVDEHAGHDHGEGGHGEEGDQHGEGESLVEPALDFLVDLDAERFRRTSGIPLSAEHQKAIADDIEKMMLRAYNMAPTDYGAYDAYFHFLMYHELRRTEEDRKRAYRMSEFTLQAVFKEKEDPMPWLTGSTATLNQFFIHQQDYRVEKDDLEAVLPADVLAKYQDRMRYCLGHYFKLREEAVEAGRWQQVAEERRQEVEERARLGMRMLEQFQAMMDREEGRGKRD